MLDGNPLLAVDSSGPARGNAETGDNRIVLATGQSIKRLNPWPSRKLSVGETGRNRRLTQSSVWPCYARVGFNRVYRLIVALTERYLVGTKGYIHRGKERYRCEGGNGRGYSRRYGNERHGESKATSRKGSL